MFHKKINIKIETKIRIRDGIAKSLLLPINSSVIHVVGIYTLVWGLWIGNPFWDVFDRASLYRLMSYFPEYFWGTIAVVCGIAMIYGVIRHSYRSLVVGANIGFYHWFIISVLYMGGDWKNTGGITALMIAIQCALLYINLKVNNKPKHTIE